jgi:hypothetical protein
MPEWSEALDYDDAIDVLREWAGRRVAVYVSVEPHDRAQQEFCAGVLIDDSERVPGSERGDWALFTVPRDPPAYRLPNPQGVAVAVHRGVFSSAHRSTTEQADSLTIVQDQSRATFLLR